MGQALLGFGSWVAVSALQWEPGNRGAAASAPLLVELRAAQGSTTEGAPTRQGEVGACWGAGGLAVRKARQISLRPAAAAAVVGAGDMWSNFAAFPFLFFSKFSPHPLFFGDQSNAR